MRVLKLFLEDFDPGIGKVSFSVEDENGDRIDRAEIISDRLKTFRPSTMDFFVLTYLPKLKSNGDLLQVQGPISIHLSNLLSNKVKAEFLVESKETKYTQEDLDIFEQTFQNTKDLSKTLIKVFSHFKWEVL